MKSLASIALMTALMGVASAQEFVPGEVLVKYRTPLTSVARTLARVEAQQVRAEVLSFNEALGVTRLTIPRGETVLSFVQKLKGQADVEFAEPNYIAHADGAPNDPYYNTTNQWGLFKIEAAAAWNVSKGDGVKVAVLDTGAQLNHPDLAGKIVLGYDFAYNDATPDDVNGHGTHTAGTVGATTDNGLGVAGAGWNVQLMIGKVLGNNGSGSYADIVDGITWAADNGAKVISMSLSGSQGSTAMSNAVTYAYNLGVVNVAAAGNDGVTSPRYPAYYTKCIAVAATDRNDKRASFSNYGSWVDIAAPGVGILSTYKNSSYAYSDGTSMAAPHVAAVAALVWASPFGTDREAVKNRVVYKADPVTVGFGSYPTRRLNARKAVGGPMRP